MGTIPELNDVAETLVENGAVYVAVNTQSLVDEPVQVYYHIPAGVSDERKETVHAYLDGKVGHRPHEREAGTIRIAEQPISACVSHVLSNDLHLYHRTPVFVDEGVTGLDPVGVDDGVANAREIVEKQPDLEPHPVETVPLEELVRELAEEGAVSVELEHEPLTFDEPSVRLRIPMVPADGQPIVGGIESVEVGGEIYPLYTMLTLDGPYGSSLDYTALYVSNNVEGLKPISVEDGLKKGRDLLEQAKDADSVQDLISARR
ncbi:hypothetical protein [Halorussus sp. AFM4]|uniref:hypothetical protein n=1 Tax=Halorussus sp. AFM4 TaxID=3421651 RepID=UPI003EBC134F